MRAQHHPHLLQHVAIVIDAGLVEADRGIDSALLEEIERCKTAAQAEIGAAIVADMGTGRGNAVEIGLVEPYAMPQCQPRPEKPETIDIIEGGAAAAPAGVFLLVGGLDEVHVHRRVVSLRIVGEHHQRSIGAPMEIGGSELNLNPFLVVVLGAELFERRRNRRATLESARDASPLPDAARPAGLP